jgi:cell division protein FtsL
MSGRSGKRRGPGWRRLRTIVVGSFIVTIAVGCALFYVWTRLQVVTWGYKLARATQRQAQLRQTNRELRIEAASLRSPGRIETIARQELGLEFSKPEQTKVVK